MFIFGSTSQDLEFLAYVGIRNCTNCGEDGHHGLYRTVGKASVYFVPVAKWEKARFVVCSRCEAGYEVTDAEANRLKRGAAKLPEPARCADIWNGLLKEWDKAEKAGQVRGDGKLDFDTLMNQALSRVEARYPESEVEAVAAWSFIVTQLQHYGVLAEARPNIDWANILWP